MKVLKETTDVQTLKIIPRIYPNEVDLTIRNETTREETTFLSLPSVFNSGYLDIANVFSLKEDTSYTIEVRTANVDGAVRCIAANNEYLSSPSGDYIGGTLNGLDIEIQYDNLTDDGDSYKYFLNQGITASTSIGTGFRLNYRLATHVMYFRLYSNNVLQTISFDLDPNPLAESGKIQVKENGGNIEIWIDGILRHSELLTISFNAAQLATYELIMGGEWGNDGLIFEISSSITFKYINIGSHEWTSPNWEAPITTNSQGVETTLHSDDNTDAMIISPSISEVIYKDKIFCTNQEDYSILDGKYTAREQNRKYTVR